MTLAVVDDNAGSNSFLTSLVIDTSAATDGVINLGGNISTADAANNDVTLTGAVSLTAAVTIDTDQTTNDGDITINGEGTRHGIWSSSLET